MKQMLHFWERSASIVIKNIAVAPIIDIYSSYFPMIRKYSLSQKVRLNTCSFLTLRKGSML